MPEIGLFDGIILLLFLGLVGLVFIFGASHVTLRDTFESVLGLVRRTGPVHHRIFKVFRFGLFVTGMIALIIESRRLPAIYLATPFSSGEARDSYDAYTCTIESILAHIVLFCFFYWAVAALFPDSITGAKTGEGWFATLVAAAFLSLLIWGIVRDLRDHRIPWPEIGLDEDQRTDTPSRRDEP